MKKETKQQRINDLAWELSEKVLRDYHYPKTENLEDLLNYAHQVFSDRKDIEFKLERISRNIQQQKCKVCPLVVGQKVVCKGKECYEEGVECEVTEIVNSWCVQVCYPNGCYTNEGVSSLTPVEENFTTKLTNDKE